jgi:hypothetical protein
MPPNHITSNHMPSGCQHPQLHDCAYRDASPVSNHGRERHCRHHELLQPRRHLAQPVSGSVQATRGPGVHLEQL